MPGTVSLWEEYHAWKETPKGQAATGGSGLIGSVDTVRRRLREFEESNVDQVILLNQAGRNRTTTSARASSCSPREVMPEFHDREAEHQEWKRGVLVGRDRARRDRHAAVQHAVEPDADVEAQGA